MNGDPGHNITSFGAMNVGGGTVNNNGVMGQQNNYPATTPAPAPAGGTPAQRQRRDANVGVVTVLRQEMRAVVGMFQRSPGYRSRQLPDGAQVHEAEFPVAGGTLRAVASQALDQGQRSAVAAYGRLRDYYRAPIVALVGIAGAINPRVAVGDVVISSEVIYYDSRRVSPEQVHRRGQSHQVTAVLRHRLHEFFRTCDGVVRDGDVPFRVHQGPIGSGDAVVTDPGAAERIWMTAYHERVLAVETEAAGVAQAFYEQVEHDGIGGWLTVRGISDHADERKDDSNHDLASRRAALVVEQLLPYLQLSGAHG